MVNTKIKTLSESVYQRIAQFLFGELDSEEKVLLKHKLTIIKHTQTEYFIFQNKDKQVQM